MSNIKTVRPPSGKRRGRKPKYSTEKERMEAAAEYRRAYYQKNKERLKKINSKNGKKRYEKHKGKIKERNRAYYKAHAHELAAWKRKKRLSEDVKRLWVAEAVQKLLAAEMEKHLSAFKPAPCNIAEGAVTGEQFCELEDIVKDLCADVHEIRKHLKWGPRQNGGTGNG